MRVADALATSLTPGYIRKGRSIYPLLQGLPPFPLGSSETLARALSVQLLTNGGVTPSSGMSLPPGFEEGSGRGVVVRRLGMEPESGPLAFLLYLNVPV